MYLIAFHQSFRKLVIALCFITIPIAGFCQLPYPKWITDMGGSGDSKPTGMAVDKQNYVYVTGYFRNTVDFDPTPYVKNLTSNGDADIYVAKYTPDGALVWAESMGGDGLDQANSLAVDAQGNVTVIGQYQSSSFDSNPGTGVATLQNNGADDIFIVHLNSNGGFLWSKSVGGVDEDRGEDVINDKEGNVITVSIYQSTFNFGGSTLSASGQFNTLFTKFDSSGNLVWKISLGQGSYNEARGVSIDSNDDIVVSGASTGSVNFNPLGTATNVNTTGAYLAKYHSTGLLVWERSITGSLVSGGSEVCVDGNNNIYIAGAYTSSMSFSGGSSLNSTGNQDLFIAQYSSSGNFNWAKDIGGAGASAYSYRLAASKDNNVYITGYFTGTIDFNPDPSAKANVSDHGQRDLFVAKYNQAGNYVYAFGAGNSDCNSTLGIELAVDGNNDLLLGGSVCRYINLNPNNCGFGAFGATNTICDSFIVKYIKNDPSQPQILTFTVPGQALPAVIDQTNYKITVTVPAGTNVKSLTPAITVSSGTPSPLSGTAQDFSSPVLYTVTSDCLSSKYTVTVVVQDVAAISACSADAVKLAGQSLASVPDSYLWQQQQDADWITAPGASNQKDYITSAYTNYTGATKTYTIRRQVTSKGNVSYDSYYALSVNPSTTNNVISADITQYCAGNNSTVNLTGNQPTGYTSQVQYQWQQSFDSSNWQNITNANQQSLQYGTAIAQSVYFRRVSTNGSCIAYSNTEKIEYSTPVTTAQAGANQTLCNQQQTVLAANIPATGETGTWTVVSPNDYAPFTDDNVHNPAATIANIPPNTTLILQWTIVKTACGQQSNSQVTITNNTPASITGFSLSQEVAPAVINQNTHTVAVQVVPGTDVSHLTPEITVNNGTLLPASGTAQNFSSPVIYALTSACGTVNYTITVTTATVSTLTACQSGDAPALQGVSSANGSSYQWQYLNGNIWANVASSSQGINYSANYPGQLSTNTVTYNFRRKVIVSGTDQYDSFYAVSYLPPISNNQITASKTIICALDASPVAFTGTAGNGGGNGKSYQWQQSTDNNNWENIASATGQNFNYTPSGTQGVYIRREIASSSGCDGYSASVKLTYSGVVTAANAGKVQNLCNQSQTSLNANAPASDETGSWSVLSSAGYKPFTSSNLHNPNAVIDHIPFDTDVQLLWTISKNSCGQQSQSSVVVRNNSLPVVNMPSTLVINLGEKANIHANVSGTGNTYSWSPVAGLTNSMTTSPTASPLETTTYVLTVTASTGCTITGSVTVQVNNDLIIPNTFTPNGDGINDYWSIKNINEYTNSEVSIYNRWGQQVYYSRGYATPWDGTYNGKPLPAATYYYLITVNDIKLKKAGYVTILY